MIKQIVFRRMGMAILATLLGSAGLTAQTPGQAPFLLPAATRNAEAGNFPVIMDGELFQASGSSCSSCGGLPGEYLAPRPGDDGCGSGCVAGGACKPCVSDTWCGRLNCCLYNALCCTDPCYEPHWIPAANSALFVDHARPQAMTRIRWDSGRGLVRPDRNEYFWPRVGRGNRGNQLLALLPAAFQNGGRGPSNLPNRLNYDDLSMHVEAGVDRFSAFVVTPYRSWQGDPSGGGSGFGDIQIGTKSLLIDTEIVQLTLQFVTYIPTGTPPKGTGTGHVSLEPSLLASVKLHEDTYLQTQIGEWIPTGGDPAVSGALLNYRFALNHVLCRPWEESQLIGALEVTGYWFQDGQYTDPATGALMGSNGNAFNIGPSVRYVLSRNCDFGFGVQFAVTEQHFAQQLYRTEMRFKF